MRDLEKSKLIHERNIQAAKGHRLSERESLLSLLEAEQDRTYELYQCTYLKTYCEKILGYSEETAKIFVRLVRSHHHVPELFDAVVSGEVFLTKAVRVISVIKPENKDEWIKKAKNLNKEELSRAVSERQGKDKKTLVIKMPFDAVDRLDRGRDLVSTKLGTYASLEETIDRAMTEFIERHDPVEKAARYQEGARAPSVKHEITLRDLEQCQWIYPDGTQCTERKWLDRHHIIHRKDGGPDTVENLVTMCAGHHRLIHRDH